MKNLNKDFSIVRMASTFNVYRGGYYKWIKNPLTKRDLENIELTQKVKSIFLNINKGMEALGFQKS